MRQPDENIMRAYFRLAEARRQRLWMQRLWHPELFAWAKGEPPPVSQTKRIRLEELAKLGFGEDHYQRMLALENGAKAELEALAETHVLWPHFQRIKGMGKYLCGCFVAAGGDIERPGTVTAFWKGMGLDVLPEGLSTPDGKVVIPPGGVPRKLRNVRGIKRLVPCMPHVSLIGEQIRMQMFRADCKLRWWYDKFRAEVDAAKPDRRKIFNMRDALRRTQKLLYACLWRVWREAYGLPAPMPYAFDILKHDSGRLITIADFYDE